MGERQRKQWGDIVRLAERDEVVRAVFQACRGRCSNDDILVEMVVALVEDRARRIEEAVQQKATEPPRPIRLPDGQWAFPCAACKWWAEQEERRVQLEQQASALYGG